MQIFLEDAGFDWKILGPDVHEFDYVAWQVGRGQRFVGGCGVARGLGGDTWVGDQETSSNSAYNLQDDSVPLAPVIPASLQCDQDAYACSGQKCSAQSILFMHDNWVEGG